MDTTKYRVVQHSETNFEVQEYVRCTPVGVTVEFVGWKVLDFYDNLFSAKKYIDRLSEKEHFPKVVYEKEVEY